MPSDLIDPILRVAARIQGAEIRAGRLANGWTQEQAAEALDIPIETYRSWDYGRRQAPRFAREVLAQLWGLDRARLGLDPERACPCCGQPYA
jgi:DNA-binding transcriptional regulator YiaG